MISINPYDEARCRESIIPYLDNIKKVFGTRTLLYYDRSIAAGLLEYKGNLYNLVKDYFNLTNPRSMMLYSLLGASVFYYFDVLLHNNPKKIMDIGCGENYFKDMIPNVYGVDINPTYADECAMFNDEYAKSHYQEFECAYSINAIHSVSLVVFKKQVDLFASMIKPGGRGMVMMNAARMLDNTSEQELLDLFGTGSPSPKQIESYLDEEIKKLSLNLLVAENFSGDLFDEYMDGNVRLVFEV